MLNKIIENLLEYGLYIVMIIIEIIGIIITKNIVHISVIVWVINSAIEHSFAKYYREKPWTDFYKGLELAIFSDKQCMEKTEMILNLQKELKKYKPEFKAVRRWRV